MNWQDELKSREPQDEPSPEPVMGAPDSELAYSLNGVRSRLDCVGGLLDTMDERDAWKLAAHRNLEAGLALIRRAQAAEKALARAEWWLALAVWVVLLLASWGFIRLVLRFASAIDQWRLR